MNGMDELEFDELVEQVRGRPYQDDEPDPGDEHPDDREEDEGERGEN